MEHVNKAKAALQPHIARLEAYLNTSEKPDPFVKLMAKLEAKTGIKRINILGGADASAAGGRMRGRKTATRETKRNRRKCETDGTGACGEAKDAARRKRAHALRESMAATGQAIKGVTGGDREKERKGEKERESDKGERDVARAWRLRSSVRLPTAGAPPSASCVPMARHWAHVGVKDVEPGRRAGRREGRR